MNCKLSIITINLNNADGLRRTIESVVSQTFQDFEYIIIDGASRDESVEVIKEFADKITYWVSEPDKGIYNAMNKGILKAKGEYLLFLNSGDWLADKVVLSDFIDANFKEDVVSGNLFIWENTDFTLMKSVTNDNLSYELFHDSSLPHPASFIKRNLFERFGLYNEQNKIVSDWEFFLKCLVISNCQYNHFERVIAYFDNMGISSLQENDLVKYNERQIVLQSYLPLVYKSFVKVSNDNQILLSHEDDYHEYMNLKCGKMGFLIRLILFLKKKKKQYI